MPRVHSMLCLDDEFFIIIVTLTRPRGPRSCCLVAFIFSSFPLWLNWELWLAPPYMRFGFFSKPSRSKQCRRAKQFEIDGNPYKSTESMGNSWKSIGNPSEIHGNQLEIQRNPWAIKAKSMEIHGYQWDIHGKSKGNAWNPCQNQWSEIHGNPWKSMEILEKSTGNRWKSK